MIPSLILLPLLGALASAQTTTLDVLFPVEGIKSVYGTVVAANSQVTTYALHCGENVDNVQCEIIGTQTVVVGPETLSINYSFDGNKKASYFSEDLSCKIKTAEAKCHIWIQTKNSAGEMVTSSITEYEMDTKTRLIPAIITEGADKLAAVEATTTPSPGAKTSSVRTHAHKTDKAIETSSEAAPTPSTATGDATHGMSVHGAVVGLAAVAAAFLMM
ncbi:GPI anchored [Fusarium beomiforme]|uniref:GPI anchored n=1 Tax=Fusarium beomiforme TaxID=44412 RepID=A0A9P5DS54_9HYPO|nr:GPI anchored [Fusarium beomiforme]